jgi:hypothetical protein
MPAMKKMTLLHPGLFNIQGSKIENNEKTTTINSILDAPNDDNVIVSRAMNKSRVDI